MYFRQVMCEFSWLALRVGMVRLYRSDLRCNLHRLALYAFACWKCHWFWLLFERQILHDEKGHLAIQDEMTDYAAVGPLMIPGITMRIQCDQIEMFLFA